jgi:predicted phosphodiesterase
VPVITLLSDLHLEFGVKLTLDLSDVDVCVIAGDLDAWDYTSESLKALTAAHACDFVFVPGNHDYYQSAPRDELEASWRQLAQETSNLHVLIGDAVELHGQRFVGHPLWYPKPSSYDWSDYRAIPDFARWQSSANHEGIVAFNTLLRPGDVAVSHMLPSYRCVAERYWGQGSNQYFVTELDDLIRDVKPAYWLHGHTHASVDLQLFDTRIVCNPAGYVRTDPNLAFDPRLRLTV